MSYGHNNTAGMLQRNFYAACVSVCLCYVNAWQKALYVATPASVFADQPGGHVVPKEPAHYSCQQGQDGGGRHCQSAEQ